MSESLRVFAALERLVERAHNKREAEPSPSPSPVVEVSEEMVESAARAIARAKRDPEVNDAVIERVWSSYIGQARAALIAALRVR